MNTTYALYTSFTCLVIRFNEYLNNDGLNLRSCLAGPYTTTIRLSCEAFPFFKSFCSALRDFVSLPFANM